MVFPGVFWYSMMFPGIPWYILVFPGIPWFLWYSLVSLVFPDVPWFSLAFPGIPWEYLFHCFIDDPYIVSAASLDLGYFTQLLGGFELGHCTLVTGEPL